MGRSHREAEAAFKWRIPAPISAFARANITAWGTRLRMLRTVRCYLFLVPFAAAALFAKGQSGNEKPDKPAVERTLHQKGSLFQLGTRQFRHQDAVIGVAYSPDGKLLASASRDKTVMLWAVEGGTLRYRADGFEDLRSLAFSPASSCLAIGDLDGVWLWNYKASRKPTRVTRSNRIPNPVRGLPPIRMQVTDVAWSRDGQMLASADCCGNVMLHKMRTKKTVVLAKGNPSLFSDLQGAVAFNPDGTLLAFSTKDSSVRLWSVDNEREVGRLVGHKQQPCHMTFSPDGRMLATASSDCLIRLWEIKTLCERKSFACSGACCMVFTRDGSTLVSAGDDGLIRLWAIPSGQLVRTLQGQYTGVVCVALSPDCKTIAAAGEDEAVRRWDMRSGQEHERLQGHTARVWSLSFSPSGKSLVSGSADGTVRLWDLAGRREIACCKGHKMPVRTTAYSPDGRFIVSAGDDGTARIWGAPSGGQIHVLRHGRPVDWVAFCKQGKALASHAADATVRLWKTTTGDELLRMRVNWCVDGLMPLPGADELILSCRDATRVWKLSDPNTTSRLANGHDCRSWLACSPDGKCFVVAANVRRGCPLFRFYDPASRRLVNELQIQSGRWNITCLSFVGSSDLLACGADDGTIRFWHLPTKSWLASLRCDSGCVLSLACSLDGALLASGHCDSGILVWPTPTPRRTKTKEN